MMGISENVEGDFSMHPTNYKGDCVRVCAGRGGRVWGEGAVLGAPIGWRMQLIRLEYSMLIFLELSIR